jgi:hypothetical protein
MFAEAFHSTIKGIHLALEVKTSYRNSTPTTGYSMKFSYLKLGVPADSHHRHRRKERKENLHLKSYKANLERLHSTRLTHHDQEVKLLDMQRLQGVNDT